MRKLSLLLIVALLVVTAIMSGVASAQTGNDANGVESEQTEGGVPLEEDAPLGVAGLAFGVGAVFLVWIIFRSDKDNVVKRNEK